MVSIGTGKLWPVVVWIVMFIEKLLTVNSAIHCTLLVLSEFIAWLMTHVPWIVKFHLLTRSRILNLSVRPFGFLPNLFSHTFSETRRSFIRFWNCFFRRLSRAFVSSRRRLLLRLGALLLRLQPRLQPLGPGGRHLPLRCLLARLARTGAGASWTCAALTPRHPMQHNHQCHDAEA